MPLKFLEATNKSDEGLHMEDCFIGLSYLLSLLPIWMMLLGDDGNPIDFVDCDGYIPLM